MYSGYWLSCFPSTVFHAILPTLLSSTFGTAPPPFRIPIERINAEPDGSETNSKLKQQAGQTVCRTVLKNYHTFLSEGNYNHDFSNEHLQEMHASNGLLLTFYRVQNLFLLEDTTSSGYDETTACQQK